MKTDGIFDYRVVEVPAVYNKPINLFFQGDEHYNSPNFSKGTWLADLKEMKEICRTAPTYFIKTGDIFEALSTSERRSYIANGFHDTTMTRWEAEYHREIDEYVKYTDFMVGRTLSVYGGNHYFQFSDGTTSDMALAAKLKAPYIGCAGYTILSFKIKGTNKGHVLKIFVHHGKSSGRRAGSTFNGLEDASNYFHDADIVVMGHDHQKGAMPISCLACEKGAGDNWKIKQKVKYIGRAGSYLKSYEAGKKSYPVDAMYRPSTLGALQFVITLCRSQANDDYDFRFKINAII